jgi:hypothetical protein
MVIDCARCELRELACGDCLVTVLAEPGQDAAQGREDGRPGRSDMSFALGAQELQALGALAAAGMVPPLRFRPVPAAKAAA